MTRDGDGGGKADEVGAAAPADTTKGDEAARDRLAEAKAKFDAARRAGISAEAIAAGKAKDEAEEQPPPRRRQVAIFGAGIAGLTAAHELVERGFEVEVFERNPPSVPDRSMGAICALGGIAMTQWGWVPRQGIFDSVNEPRELYEAKKLEVDLDETESPTSNVPKWRVEFDAGATTITTPFLGVPARVHALVQGHGPELRMEIRGYTSERVFGVDAPETRDWQRWAPHRVDSQRAVEVANQLVHLGIPAECLMPVGFGLGYADDWTKADVDRDYVAFHLSEDWLPGEHGFRFFPCYYRNVFDTMRRIPIPDDHATAFHATPRTVLDNLVPTARMAMQSKHSAIPFQYETRPRMSGRVLFEQIRGILNSTGNRLEDIAHFQGKILKFLTSCEDRRDQYAKQSWFEYLEAWRGSEAFQRHIDSSGEIMVSMQARNCDARSYGSSSVQLLAAMMDPKGRTDAVLNGPTSLAWFDPWRQYLESQGVVFHRGELLEFVRFTDTEIRWPIVKMDRDGASDVLTMVDRDYYVVALGPVEMQKLARENQDTLEGGDFDKIREFPLGDPSCAKTGGALEHMSGVQYYFDSDFKFIDGHIMSPHSDFRLSAIFQPQFWTQKRSWWSGYRGLLSVDLSNWHNGETWAWDLPTDELAKAVLDQLDEGFKRKRKWLDKNRETRKRGGKFFLENVTMSYRGHVLHASSPTVDRFRLPMPMYFHVDQYMEYETDNTGKRLRVKHNKSPYLMCRPGDYEKRPGKPGAYKVHKGNIVLAGTLMQTHVRLTTMEAANESGRHAANAILNKEGFGSPRDNQFSQGERCFVYNLEDFEPEDFAALREIDQGLFDAKLPHMFEILDPRDLPEAIVQVMGKKDETQAEPAVPELELGKRGKS